MYSEEKNAEHQVFGTMKNCIQKFEEERGKDHGDFFTRLVQLCKIIQKRLKSIDFYIAPTYVVDAIQNNLQKALNEYNSFKTKNNVNHLPNIERSVEAALVQSKQLFVGTDDIEKDYADALKSFRKSASQHLRYFEKDLDDLKETHKSTSQKIESDLQTIKNQIADQNKRIDGVVNNFQNQVSELQQQQIQNFQENENSRQAEFKERIENFSSSFTEELKSLKEKSKSEFESITQKTTSIVDLLEEKREEALKLVGVIANTGMAGGYQKVANQAMWTKRFWQSATVVSLAVLIWFSIDMYQTGLENGSELSLGAAGIRAFVTIAIALFAGYAAKQADINSKIERKNRQMELELSSIDMYIAKFDDKEQLVIKKKLSDKWFGNIQADKFSKESPSQTTLLGHLSETVRNLSEKIGN